MAGSKGALDRLVPAQSTSVFDVERILFEVGKPPHLVSELASGPQEPTLGRVGVVFLAQLGNPRPGIYVERVADALGQESKEGSSE